MLKGTLVCKPKDMCLEYSKKLCWPRKVTEVGFALGSMNNPAILGYVYSTMPGFLPIKWALHLIRQPLITLNKGDYSNRNNSLG